MVLVDAAHGFRVTNLRHKTDARISEIVASRGLEKLSDVGLLVRFGEKPGKLVPGRATLDDAPFFPGL